MAEETDQNLVILILTEIYGSAKDVRQAEYWRGKIFLQPHDRMLLLRYAELCRYGNTTDGCASI